MQDENQILEFFASSISGTEGVLCDELRELATDYPMEMGVIVEMLIDAEEDLCQES